MQRFSSYGERDYAFGRAMLGLRTALGLTQASLAEWLGVTRKAIGRWEAGETYPKAEHLKALLALALEQQAFSAGHEEEEIRAFWKAAHQKVPLDERWLQQMLDTWQPRLELVNPQWNEQVPDQPTPGRRVDWGEALAVPAFYGRAEELARLWQWVVQEGCRVVSVLGLGGIGKSALAVQLMHQAASHFEVVIWRSLRDAPPCEVLLDDCLRVLAPQALRDVSVSLERRLGLLMEHLGRTRVLLVLDNLEALLEEGQSTGYMSAGNEGYARLLRLVAEARHQSCLLLTSREKPGDLVPLEGNRTPVRTLRLAQLDSEACQQLLVQKEVVGNPADYTRLIEAYAGNPLALNIVGQTIVDLFAGQIAPFLEQGEVIFGGIRDLLARQFIRLSTLEQTLLLWLAILREPVSLKQLLELLVTPFSGAEVLEAIEALHRRSLVERGQYAGSFTLQSVVLEYATVLLVTEASREIEHGRLVRLIELGLELAAAKEYVRQTQRRLLVVPLLVHMQRLYSGRVALKEHLLRQLDELRTWADDAQGYGPANLLALLRELRGQLRGLDLSQLSIRGAFLQGVELQDASLAGALLRESVFTETFDAIWSVAISRSGRYWAAGSKRGEVRIWRVEQEAGQTLHLVWQAHTDIVVSLAFSPDERTLVSGSLDGSLKLWDVESGIPLWTIGPIKGVLNMAFAPDGHTLASSGNETTVRLWDARHGTALEDVPHSSPVFSLAWSPDGHCLASGGFDGHIRLWQRQRNEPALCVQTLSGHTNLVRGLAFSPDGSVLASASWDGSVKLWKVGHEGSFHVSQTLVGHTGRMQTVVWSSDGRILASGGGDHTIRLWDAQQGGTRSVLLGHSAPVYSLAFTDEGRSLLSGSEDGTLRLWEVERGQCARVIRGHTVSLYDLDWSPSGTHLVTGGSDTLVTVWLVNDRGQGKPQSVLQGHDWTVYGVGWSPDGSKLASSGWDNAIRLWDPSTETCTRVLRDLDHPDNTFFGVSWSPDGQRLASGTYRQGVLVWDMTEHDPQWMGRAHTTWVRRVAWSPDGTRVAGGDEDGDLYVWDASNGTQLLQLARHQGAVMSIAWSPDGSLLASGDNGREGGELYVRDAQSGQLVRTFVEHPGVVSALIWAPRGERLISGSSDGSLRWWDIEREECVLAREAHQGTVQALKVSPDGRMLASCGDDGAMTLWDLESGEHLRTLRRDRPYERLDISGVKGLTQAQKASLHALGAIERAL